MKRSTKFILNYGLLWLCLVIHANTNPKYKHHPTSVFHSFYYTGRK